jgi:hypothetical protein
MFYKNKYSSHNLEVKVEIHGKRVHITANVLGTDDVIENRRGSWVLGYWKRNSTGFFLVWRTTVRNLKTIRIPRVPWANSAKENSNMIGERIAYLVAPRYKSDFHYQSPVVRETITEILNQIKTIEVLGS